jgi:hypothetical protein
MAKVTGTVRRKAMIRAGFIMHLLLGSKTSAHAAGFTFEESVARHS